jgi:hypothetical protein
MTKLTMSERLRMYAALGQPMQITLEPVQMRMVADVLEDADTAREEVRDAARRGLERVHAQLGDFTAKAQRIERMHRRAKAYLLLSAALGLTLAFALVVTVS